MAPHETSASLGNQFLLRRPVPPQQTLEDQSLPNVPQGDFSPPEISIFLGHQHLPGDQHLPRRQTSP